MVAFVDSAHTIYVYNVGDVAQAQITLKCSLFGNTQNILSLAFSPNGQLLAVSAGHSIKIYNLETRHLLFEFDKKTSNVCHEGNVTALLFKTDELLLSGGYDSDIKAYFVTQAALKEHVKLVNDSTKDQLLLHAEGYNLCYIDGINAHKTQVNGLVQPFGESNLVGSFSRDGVIKIFDVSSWMQQSHGARQVWQLEGHKSEVLAGCFSQSQKKFLAGSKDNHISVWDLETGQVLKLFPAHAADVNFVRFLNADQFMLTAAFNGEFKLWKAEGGEVAAVQDNIETKTYETEDQQAQGLLQQPDLAKLLKSQSMNTLVEVPIASFQLHENEMHAAVMGAKKPILVTAQQTQYLRFWNISSVTQPAVIKEVFSHTDEISAIETVDTDARLCVFGSRDGFFSVTNCLRAQKLISTSVDCAILDIKYDAQRDRVFVATQLYEILGFQLSKDQTPRRFAVFRGHIAAVSRIQLVNDILVSGSADGVIHTWEVPAAGQPQEIVVRPSSKSQEHDGFITSLAQCGEVIASAASDHSIIIYRLQRSRLQKLHTVHSAHASYISGLGFLDKTVLVSCSHDSTIKVFNIGAPARNRAYNKTKAVYTANLEDLGPYAAKMAAISSDLCSRIAACPFNHGLPNCISVGHANIAIGTTNGQVFILDHQLNLTQINDLHEDGVGEVISAIKYVADTIVVGTSSGTIHVWGQGTAEKTTACSVFSCSGIEQ